MKAIGMYRKVDELGRIVLPAELRKMFGITVGDRLEIFVDGERIVLSKLDGSCAICGSADKLVEVKDRAVCVSCRRIIAKKG